MNFTDKQVVKFQQIFEEEFGHKMSRQEAIESATNLIRYFEIALPIAKRIQDRDSQNISNKEQ